MATSGFAGAPFPSAGTGNAGASSIYLTKIVLQRAATVSAVLLDVASAASGIQARALIYDSAHSALLASGAISSSLAVGYNRLPLSASLALAAGTYYVGYVSNSAVSVSIAAGQTGSSWWVSGGQSVTSPANPLVGGSAQSNGLMIAVEFDGASAAGFGFASDYTTGIALSASNTVATTSALGMARSVVAQRSSGKYYAEVAVGGTQLDSNATVGLVSAAFAMSSPTSSSFHNVDLTPAGTTVGSSGAGNTATTVPYARGDVVGVAYDAGAARVWFNKNGGGWAGSVAGADPGTSSSGIAVPGGTWPMTVGVSATSSGGAFTLRDTASQQTFTKPTGYSAWSSATGPTSPGAAAQPQVCVIT